MSWSETQKTRLVHEKEILKTYFSTFEWKYPTDPQRAYVEGAVKTNSGRSYDLRIYIPANFPSSCPQMVVSRPVPLIDRDGKAMTYVSETMHLLGEHEGRTKICHYRYDLWVPSNTLYKVALKGRIWLEAYDAHIRTGYSLDRFLRHMSSSSAPSAPRPPVDPPTQEENFLMNLYRRIRRA